MAAFMTVLGHLADQWASPTVQVAWLRSSDQHATLNLRPWLSTHLQKMQLFLQSHAPVLPAPATIR